jgi:hypothetical protein
MTAARRSVGRQYIFITPNAIDGKNSLDKDVKIIRYAAIFRSEIMAGRTNVSLLDSVTLANDD